MHFDTDHSLMHGLQQLSSMRELPLLGNVKQ
uniref:Uncharacterized protein n=1 Tax=Arundo donax TaxID=35708 RepID=A0A0A8YP59_ARUDO